MVRRETLPGFLTSPASVLPQSTWSSSCETYPAPSRSSRTTSGWGSGVSAPICSSPTPSKAAATTSSWHRCFTCSSKSHRIPRSSSSPLVRMCPASASAVASIILALASRFASTGRNTDCEMSTILLPSFTSSVGSLVGSNVSIPVLPQYAASPIGRCLTVQSADSRRYHNERVLGAARRLGSRAAWRRASRPGQSRVARATSPRAGDGCRSARPPRPGLPWSPPSPLPAPAVVALPTEDAAEGKG